MRITACYFRRLILTALGIALLFCFIQVLRLELSDNDLTNEDKLIHMSELIKNSGQHVHTLRDGVAACKLPELDVHNPEIMKFIQDVPPLKCLPEDWVVVNGSKLIVSDKARADGVICTFREIIRVDDYNTKLLDGIPSNTFYILQNSDFADVRCESPRRKKWHSVLTGVKDDPEVKKKHTWENVSPEALKLNVLMFGFDSLSRNTFIRKLPKTYRYLKQTLNSLILEGYNIVGDGTPQALIPILTGKIELELPETRKRMGSKANYVNVYPMIWNQYKDSGYITGFMEDVHHIGTFTYRLKGFNKQPTDHYMRTFYLAAAPYFKYSEKYCMSGIPRHMVMMNYIKAICDVYANQPKFLFGFHGELSHDSYNDIGVVDDDLYFWIKDLHDAGHLNNSVLILMSDHGHRFADIRNTVQGKQEERLPFFSFTFPPWFKQIHPEAYANFVHNTQYLTTPFDVHKTLETILKFHTMPQDNLHERSISLFNKVPLDRTCADAFIEPHWCACLSWQEIAVNDPKAVSAAKHFIEFLNAYTKDYRSICEPLTLSEILWSAKLIPTKGLLDFRKSGDQDGFLGDFSAQTKLTSEVYQVKIKTEPGNGLFEASISYDLRKDTFKMKITDVSRINKYGSQARCVENSLFHLRKYCYCKN